MTNCIFCKIIRKEAPATIVFENNLDLGVVPLDLVAEGHTLLMPKKHCATIFDADETSLKQLIVDAKILAEKLTAKHNASGINMLHASGKDAQQSVPHFHFHLIPRHSGDGLDLWVKNQL